MDTRLLTAREAEEFVLQGRSAAEFTLYNPWKRRSEPRHSESSSSVSPRGYRTSCSPSCGASPHSYDEGGSHQQIIGGEPPPPVEVPQSRNSQMYAILLSPSPTRPLSKENSGVLRRTVAWQQQKEKRMKELKESLETAKYQECSFHPKVLGGPSDPGTVNVDQLVNRLSVPREPPPQAEEKLPAECTFEPNTDKSRLSFDKTGACRIWYSRESSLYSQKSSTQSPRPLAFSHHPQTNSIQDNMVNCRAYVQENVFSRLARPLENEESCIGEDTLASCTLSSAHPSSPPSRRNNQYPTNVYGNIHCINNHYSSNEPLKESATADELWNDFLERQMTFHRERDESLAYAKELEEDAMFRPELCMKSRTIVRKNRHRPVVTRQTSAPSFSFQPSIRNRSKRLPTRSDYSRSIGDQMKREETIRQLKKKVYAPPPTIPEKPEFTPVLIAKKKVTTSMRERLDQKRTEREEQRIKDRDKRESQNWEECSFRPKIKDAPYFIRRVAASYRISQQMKEENAKAGLV